MSQYISNLPVGAKVKFGKYSVSGETAQPIVWLVVAKGHESTPSYPSNAITLLTEKVIDFLPFDAREPGNMESASRQQYGNNRYSLSNIDQWLNKDSSPWFVPSHSKDTPPSLEYTDGYKIAYENRPGFLNAFTDVEKAAILETNIRVALGKVDGEGTEDITRRVFLPSVREVGYLNFVSDGSTWEYFLTNSKKCEITDQARAYSSLSSKPTSPDYNFWWLRSAVYINDISAQYVHSEESCGQWEVMTGRPGVRPALNLSSSIVVSDGIDENGCYSVIWNSAPSTPSFVNIPNTIYGGKLNTISWGATTDIDGDSITYHLECSIDGAEYLPIYSGGAISYAHLVPFNTMTVAYRVRATDPYGEGSTYIDSPVATVVNNYAPVISGSDTNLGVKSDDFTGTYTITDANSDIVTVTEAIDGVQIRALVTTLGQPITYGVTGNTWLALANGSHTLTISATDGIDTTVRTIVFTKLVDKFSIQNSTPWASSTMPSRIMLVVTRNIPSTSTFKVEVCNNGNDASPTWENATDAVVSGLVHVFSNTKKTASNWGVLVRVTVERNGATGACYVSAIGGNFE